MHAASSEGGSYPLMFRTIVRTSSNMHRLPQHQPAWIRRSWLLEKRRIIYRVLGYHLFGLPLGRRGNVLDYDLFLPPIWEAW